MKSILIFLAALTLAAADRPNIVFIFSDDHATQSIGAYGSTINKTPNIDRLAETGAIFEKSFCCNSICGPSRAAVLTGKHSHKNGFLGNFTRTFDGTQFTFPQALQKAGYQTAMIGKWHLKSNPTGFDYWEILPGQGSYYNPDFISKDGKKRYTGYCTTVTTDRALDWLKTRDESRPFLLMCQHKAPHRTWAPDIKHLNRYADRDIPEPATLFDAYENRSSTLAKNAMSIDTHFYYNYDLKVREPVPFASKRETRLKASEFPRMNAEQKAAWDAAFGPRNAAFLANPPTGKDLVRWKYQRYIKNYLRCIDSVDENVGRVLDYLEANGLRENTLIVYSSDQGFYLGEHGWYDKRWMFEESLRMPLLMSWPKVVAPGQRISELVQNIDYAPTFLEVAGVPSPAEVQGRSLLPLLGKDDVAWRDAIYYHYYEHGGEHQVPRHEGVRTARYKLINFYSSDGYNLFDLEKDPNEMASVHNNPEYAGILTQMKSKLADLRKSYDLPALKGKK
jgi:arylsulfatase A-like enzyme